MCSRTMWSVDGQPVLIGRTMDWTESLRTRLYVMPRGIEMDGLVHENPLKWTSKYGSVVSSAYDCSTMDGMNEAGLCVNCNYLAEATYGERDPSVPGVSLSVYLQYFLDTCATVAEAVEASKTFQVQPLIVIHKGVEAQSPMHLSFGDRAIAETG